ncbi:MAG: cyclic-di-AMP receptor [Armatimonadetes bacterium]|nr:cyclic-di-AMP receptor [Armatimonadota bacterium]
MKLILAIVQERDSRRLIDGLMEKEFQATVLASTGGFLREGNTTILIGVEDEQVDAVLQVIQQMCHSREQLISPLPPVVEPIDAFITYPVKVLVGGATVFVLNVDRMEKV